MSKTKTPSQLKTANKKAENKKKAEIYLQGQDKIYFCNWLMKKYKCGKFDLAERELNILKSLDRIKRIERSGSFRVFKFIQNFTEGNRSFYIILDGFGGAVRAVKEYVNRAQYLAELKGQNYK